MDQKLFMNQKFQTAFFLHLLTYTLGQNLDNFNEFNKKNKKLLVKRI